MSDKKWFETWFDTPYYHLLYNNRNSEEAKMFISNLVSYLQLDPQTKVLDVACGKGRHSRYLAQLGYDTIGIDLSCHSIDEANQDLLPNLKFEVWDMRKVYKHATFDLVVNLFSSFGYFDNEEDDQSAIRAMADDLIPGGTLVIDYMNSEYISKIIKARDIVDRGQIQFHIKKKIENGFVKKEIDFLAEGQNLHFEEQLKLIRPEQFQRLLTSAGLNIVHFFGSYELEPFAHSYSPRQIIIARKS